MLLSADDDSDSDASDPAQLAFTDADAQSAAQQQLQQQQQQIRRNQQLEQESRQHLVQHQQVVARAAEGIAGISQPLFPYSGQRQNISQSEQAGAAEKPVEHGHLCFDAASVDTAEEEEEELICMDDPRFASLSERRQKLMALEEVLLNTGIDG